MLIDRSIDGWIDLYSLADYLKWWLKTFSSMETKMFQILAVDKYPLRPTNPTSYN